MVDPSTSPSKSKGKQTIVSSDESDDEPSGLRELLTELEGVYQHTRTRTSTIAPVNFNALARGMEVREAHSTIAEFICIAYMAGTPEEVPKSLEEQAQVQREQLDMICGCLLYTSPSPRDS